MEHTVRHIKGEMTVEDAPDRCPFCHTGLKPTLVFAHNTHTSGTWIVLMNCPMDFCQESFIAYYEPAAKQQHLSHPVPKPKFTGKTSFGATIGKDFSDEIKNVSPSFCKIYNELYAAEQQGLLEVCGVGYRKALEFMIKDYAIQKQPDKQDDIEKKTLMSCISDHVTNERVKTVAKRATWLGNDETHYVRKWEGKNLTDLKSLIILTLHWIETEVLTDSLEIEMPDPKTQKKD